jgi:hypothetical protein
MNVIFASPCIKSTNDQNRSVRGRCIARGCWNSLGVCRALLAGIAKRKNENDAERSKVDGIDSVPHWPSNPVRMSDLLLRTFD